MRFTAWQTTTVFVEPEEAEEVYNYLVETFLGDWELNDQEITMTEKVTGNYEPEVRYTKNGDGNPAIWELDEGMDETWLKDNIKENIGIDVEVQCELE